jgi:hypothetical protein
VFGVLELGLRGDGGNWDHEILFESSEDLSLEFR